MVVDMGLGWAIVQFQDVQEDEIESCFWVTLYYGHRIHVAVYVRPGHCRWFNSPQTLDVMRVASAPLLLCTLGLVPGAMLLKNLQLDKMAQADVVPIVGLPVTLVAWNGAGLWALVFGGMAQAVVRTVTVVVKFYPWWPRFKPLGGVCLKC